MTIELFFIVLLVFLLSLSWVYFLFCKTHEEIKEVQRFMEKLMEIREQQSKRLIDVIVDDIEMIKKEMSDK